MADDLDLSTLKPAQPRKDRKRVGRGQGSGKGRYSGRGIKGQKSRSGSHSMPAGFEGGQMPLDMRLGKLRGNTSADAMPIGPFRTYSQPVNLRDLDRFDAGTEVTPEVLKAAGLIGSTRKDVKILGSRSRRVRRSRLPAARSRGCAANPPSASRSCASAVPAAPRPPRPAPTGAWTSSPLPSKSRAPRQPPRARASPACSAGSPTPGACRSSGGASSSRR
jgi:large subunit ribosomal protein L15